MVKVTPMAGSSEQMKTVRRFGREHMAVIEESIKCQLTKLQSEKDDSYDIYQEKLNEIVMGIDRFYDAIASGLDPDICKQKFGTDLTQKKRDADQ